MNIYYDALQEAEWFQNLHGSFKNCNLKPFTKIRKKMENLLAYDRPDIILEKDKEAVLVLEKTEEVPTGHNVGQRFARLVKAAEENVPVIYYLPFAAMKHGDYAGPCWLNVRLIKTMFKIKRFYDTPFLAVKWPHDERYELIRDGSENKDLRLLFKDLVENDFNWGELETIRTLVGKMAEAYKDGIERRSSYLRPPPSVKFVDTVNFFDKYHLPKKKMFIDRTESLIYKIEMTEKKCRREDPYTGTQLLYDFLYCRTGTDKTDRFRNLILWFPKIRKSVWFEKNPFDDDLKRGLWYEVPDLLLFKDGYLDPVVSLEGNVNQQTLF